MYWTSNEDGRQSKNQLFAPVNRNKNATTLLRHRRRMETSFSSPQSQPDNFYLICEGVPDLDIERVNSRARQLEIKPQCSGANRPLRGCLLADRGSGYILYDASDPLDEQRFTKAHELAHFLADYHFPRSRALRLLGELIRPVLDGLREPTLSERTQAAMLNCHLGILTRLMERPEEGLPETMVLTVENRADRLALELLAPARIVNSRLDQFELGAGGATKREWLAVLLQNEFGLPCSIAAGYASELIRRRGGSDLLDWIISHST